MSRYGRKGGVRPFGNVARYDDLGGRQRREQSILVELIKAADLLRPCNHLQILALLVNLAPELLLVIIGVQGLQIPSLLVCCGPKRKKNLNLIHVPELKLETVGHPGLILSLPFLEDFDILDE